MSDTEDEADEAACEAACETDEMSLMGTRRTGPVSTGPRWKALALRVAFATFDL